MMTSTTVSELSQYLLVDNADNARTLLLNSSGNFSKEYKEAVQQAYALLFNDAHLINWRCDSCAIDDTTRVLFQLMKDAANGLAVSEGDSKETLRLRVGSGFTEYSAVAFNAVLQGSSTAHVAEATTPKKSKKSK